jgi:hypothetical protein
MDAELEGKIQAPAPPIPIFEEIKIGKTRKLTKPVQRPLKIQRGVSLFTK